MRQLVATLIPAVFVGGCSLIYNENNIDKPTDARVFMDAGIDANAAALTLTSVETPALLEGQGDEGSRPAVLVVRGTNIVNGATVTVTATTGTAMVEVVDEPAIVSPQSDLIVVKVIARVDTTLAANTTKDLVIKVSQPSPMGGNIEQTTMWQLKGLGELEGATATVDTSMAREYSRVSVGTLNYSGTGRLIVRATAGISVTNAINVSAVTATNSATPGPGGFPGGAGGSGSEGDGMGPGLGKKGVAGSKGGGGAGFTLAGEDGGSNPASGGAAHGDVLITRYATNVGSGGGGATGFGGAGGGTLELSAGGTLNVGGLISANGSVGKSGTLLFSAGGGGAGGVVVLRSFATATVTGISVAGGLGGTGGLNLGAGDGGDGRDGRARIDAVSITGDSGAAHRGVMFDAMTPTITRASMPTLHLLGSTGDRFDLQRANASFAPQGAKETFDFGGATEVDQIAPTLEPGWNRLCLIPENSGLGNPESRNCIEIAYVP